jgi:multidrug resistance efflux pump
MSQVPPKSIPIPAWKRWMEFRHRVLPSIMFVVVLFLVGFLWKSHLTSPSLIGQVQTMRLDIRTPSSGTLTNLAVELYQKVRKGDIIAKLDPGDPLTSLGSQAQVLLAKKELLQLMNLTTAANVFDIQRNVMDKERLRTELLQQKVNLASAEISLKNLENEWHRSKGLFDEKLLSESAYDRAEKAFLAAKAEVEARNELISDLGRTIQSIESLIEGSREIEEAKLEIDRTTLQRSIAKLEQEWLIRAPVDGVITAIQKRSGEMVGSSDSIATLTQSGTRSVIAFLPQGSEIPLSIGQSLEIKTRSQFVKQCKGTVTKVGESYEPMPDQLSQLQLFKIGGIGIPILIELPDEFQCLPGELVNITFNTPVKHSKTESLAER